MARNSTRLFHLGKQEKISENREIPFREPRNNERVIYLVSCINFTCRPQATGHIQKHSVMELEVHQTKIILTKTRMRKRTHKVDELQGRFKLHSSWYEFLNWVLASTVKYPLA